MRDVSISRFNPSCDGVDVCSSCVWVRTVSTWLILNGETKCVPSGIISPVTRPNEVSTPALPGGTYASEHQPNMTNRTTTTPARAGAESERGFELMIRGSKCAIQNLLLSP